MARIYGEQSRMMLVIEKYYFFSAFYFAALVLYLSLGVLNNIKLLFSIGGLIAFLLIVLPIITLLLLIRKYFKVNAIKYYLGRKGETKVRYILSKLPNNYVVFINAKVLPPYNIDFIVLGPTGLFAIEVKSHNGQISFDGSRLLKNGKPFKEKDPLAQAMSEALALREKVCAKFCYPVLVFSNGGVKLRFGFNDQKSVYVLKKEFLNKFILSREKSIDDNMIVSLEEKILQYVKNNDKSMDLKINFIEK